MAFWNVLVHTYSDQCALEQYNIVKCNSDIDGDENGTEEEEVYRIIPRTFDVSVVAF